MGFGKADGTPSAEKTVVRTMARRDVCWLCGGKLIWGADFDAQDYGYESEGIVALFRVVNVMRMSPM